VNTDNNKYKLWYFNIIENAKRRVLPENVYSEIHHIIPESIGGLNTLENKVVLSAREHYICHLLLPRFLKGAEKKKMEHALWLIVNTRDTKVNSRVYESLKSIRSKNMTGNSWNKGVPKTLEHKNKISKSKTGKPSSKKGKSYGHIPWNKGLKLTEEQKKKQNIKGLKSQWGKSKKHSSVTRAKISAARIRYLNSLNILGDTQT